MMDNLAFLHQAAVEAASENDRVWFEANPDRHMRLRDPLGLEFNGPPPPCPPGFTVRVIVVQVAPGVRQRCTVGLAADLPNEGAEDRDIDEVFRRYGPPAAYEQALKMIKAIKASPG